ncbi:HAD-IC family P-type ATPase [Paenarthrobacter sp. Z7-10]|uniref:HAD-IC family P-type ATPase n=1 Tax=Paenarthrobacter sp. Z7-10 TaxID=2787635 RepID=UPI002E76FF39|nr:HAD-IC family P-type ATPase [Paenarthrobacter sp. Z7-10]MCZ2403755.1 HAD-IC family P-type ATPase [Paenarthrobacter sp. Z7-10]
MTKTSNHAARLHRQRVADARAALPSPDPTALAVAGLDDEQVRVRHAAGLTNAVPHESSRSIWQILRANLFTLFNAVLGACLLIVLAVGDPRDALFGFIVLANAAIGVVQEYRAKRALDRLAVLHAPTARVLRAGEVQNIAVAAVVHDDVLVLRSGDQIPADAVILSVEGLEVEESLLTGESEPELKEPGAEVLSGSAVVAGSGAARVIRVGAESYASVLTAEAKRFSLVNSEIRNAINRIILYITWALIPIIVLVVNSQMQAKGGWEAAIATGEWKGAVVSAVASIVAMIPEGLVLLTSISFGLAAVTLARRQVLVQELPAVEGLARVDMICLDKTGTLTEGEIIFDGPHRVTSAAPVGWELVLGWLAGQETANATAASLRSSFAEIPGIAPLHAVPFNSARKWSAVSFDTAEADRFHSGHAAPIAGTWVFGAPEMVLDAADLRHGEALNQAAALSALGLRALVLAHTPEPVEAERGRDSKPGLLSATPGGPPSATTGGPPQITPGLLPSATAGLPPRLPSGLLPVMLLTFREKVRSDAAETLRYFREQGVALRILSGDSPRTVAAVAREVGFVHVGEGYDARGLPTDPDGIAEVLEREHVLGRVTPEQKKSIVLALQQRGHVVAMTGDGVNDALALKYADIGIAMGSGAAATKAVSRLVLLDGAFSRMPGVVAEGRRVIANVERVANLFLTKTAYAVVISLVIGVLLWQYPFLPRQLSIVSSLTIGIPAFFLALLPNKRRYQPGFLRRCLMFSIPAGLIISACILAVYSYARAFPNPELDPGGQIRSGQTAATMAVLLVALWVLSALARPFDRWRALLVAAMAALLAAVLAVPFGREFFALQVPTGDLLAVTMGVVVLGCAGIEVLYRSLKRAGAVSERE